MGIAQKITNFLGILPRTAERLLPDMAAVAAEGVNLTSGEIRPVRPPYQAYIPTVIAEMFAAYRADNGTTEKWRTWQMDVDVARAPLSPDVEPRYYWTGDSCPRYATFTGFGTTDWALGIPNPAVKPVASSTGGVGTTVNRTYLYTFYQPATGEESGPSPVAAIVAGKVDGTWIISGFSGTPANDRTVAYNTAGLKQRLYRTSGTVASFQMVAERDVSTANWTDTLTDSAIPGDELISSEWEPPPVGLKGLLTLPNGAMVGFYNNELLYSELYQPHTWPASYRYQVDSKIVGIAAYGTAVVVCTETRPVVFDGLSPDVVAPIFTGQVWPCLSKHSVRSVDDGVIYATRQGLAYVGQTGAQILTKDLYTTEEWMPLNPSSMRCAVADNRVYAIYTPTDGQPQMLKIDVQERAVLSTYSVQANALYVDPLNGKLYVIGKQVDLFDGYYGQRMTFNWKSKEYELPVPVNLGAGLVEWEGTMLPTEVQAAFALQVADQAANQAVIDSGVAVGAFAQTGFNTDPVNGASGINTPRSPAEYLYYTLFDHDQAVMTVAVIPGKAFRLPSGYKTDAISHQLVGNVRVKCLKVAETMVGLKQV